MFSHTTNTIDKTTLGNKKPNQYIAFGKWVGKKKLFLAMVDKINASEIFEFFEKKIID